MGRKLSLQRHLPELRLYSQMLGDERSQPDVTEIPRILHGFFTNFKPEDSILVLSCRARLWCKLGLQVPKAAKTSPAA